MIGKKFGKLTVLAKSENTGANGKFKYIVQCECGKIYETLGSSMRRKKRARLQCWECGRKEARKKISGEKHYLYLRTRTDEERNSRRNWGLTNREEYQWRKIVYKTEN